MAAEHPVLQKMRELKIANLGDLVKHVGEAGYNSILDHIATVVANAQPGKDQVPPGSPTFQATQLAEVIRFSEDPRMVGALQASHKSPTQYVDGFRAVQARKPEIRATDYGVPAR